MDRERFSSAGVACSGVLLTGLYELTMLQAYHARAMNGTAVSAHRGRRFARRSSSRAAS